MGTFPVDIAVFLGFGLGLMNENLENISKSEKIAALEYDENNSFSHIPRSTLGLGVRAYLPLDVLSFGAVLEIEQSYMRQNWKKSQSKSVQDLLVTDALYGIGVAVKFSQIWQVQGEVLLGKLLYGRSTRQGGVDSGSYRTTLESRYQGRCFVNRQFSQGKTFGLGLSQNFETFLLAHSSDSNKARSWAFSGTSLVFQTVWGLL